LVVILDEDGCGFAGARAGKLSATERWELVSGREREPPQEPVWDTEEREDCAVDDFNFKTLLVLAFEVVVDVEGVVFALEVMLAQPIPGRFDELFMPLGPGSEG
jgi:hypothetical protein